MRAIGKKLAALVGYFFCVAALGFAAATAIRLTTQVSGILPVANGGSGVATAAAGTAFSGPLIGSAAAPSFKALTVEASNSIPRPNLARWGNVIVVQTTSPFVRRQGENFTTSGTGSIGAASSTLPLRYVEGTGNTINTVVSFNGSAQWTTGNNIKTFWNARTSLTTNVRFFAGMTDQTVATMGAADAPAGNWAVFRYSTNVGGETTYKCGASNAGTSNFQNSGISTDTSFHKFEIDFNDSVPNITFYIDGALVCTETSATYMPASGITTMTFSTGTTLASSAPKNLEQSWFYTSSTL